jgi:RimJ/RimL family protein N-acetyltransferase
LEVTVRLLAADGDQFNRLLAGSEPTDGIVMLAGPIAEKDVLAMLAGLACTIRETFAPSAWWIIAGNALVGLLSVTAVLKGGVLQIGYGVAPNAAGRGHATAAIAEMLIWAKADARVSGVYAETHIANVASQRVLARNGFFQIGQRLDDQDGEVLCWRTDC